MTSGDHESVKLALQSLQAQTALPAGEIIIRHIELGKSGNKIAYATIGSQPIIVRSPNAKDVQMFTEPLPFQDEITCSAVFTVGNHDHYFAIGCADGSVGVFYANPSSPNLKVISYFTPSKGVNGVSNNTFKQAKDKRTQGFTGPPIQALHFVPLTCLKRFQDSIVYLWISTDVSLFLGVFRKSTEGPIKCILTTTLDDTTIAKSAPDATSRNGKPSTATKAFPRLLNCEYLHTSLGQNTCMVLHFLCGTTAEDGIQSTVATGTAPIQALEGEIRAHHVSAAQSHVRIIALDLRLVLHIAEKTRRSGADIPSVLPLHLCSALVLPLSGTHNQVRTSPAKSAIDTVFSSQVQALSVRAPPTAIPLGLQNSKYTKSVSNVQNTSGGGDHWEHALTAVTVPTFSFSATVTLLSGRNVHGMLKTALHVVNDVMMSSGVKLFTDPKSVVVVFEPAASPVGNDRRHLQSVNNNLQIAGAKVERCSLLDALCMLGLTSLPASGWDEATSTEAVLNASLHLGQASLLRKALLTPMHAVEVALSNAVGKSHRSSYGAEEGQNALQSVKTVHSWAVLVQKTLLEGSLVALLRSEVIPILLGKMPTRAAPLDSSYVPGSAVPQQQFSTDIPGPLTAALQETFCTAQGLACLIDGLHNRKAAELSHALALTAHSKPSSLIGRQGWARTPTNLRSAPAILELESALAELQRQKRELHCIAQIVSVVIIILEWRGLSFYPLLQGYKAVQDYRMKQHAAAVATFNGEHLALPDKPNSTESAKAGSSNGPFGTQQHATQLLVSKSTFAVLSSTYEDLLSTLVGKLEPELRCIADLSSISHDARPVERILALFMLPLTNLRSVCGKMLAKEHQQDSASMNMDDGEVHASSMDTTNGESLPSVDDAADIGHCIVQYVVMDMILLSTAPAFATGAMARAGCSQSQAHHSNRHGINTNVTHLVKAAELEAGRIALDTFPVLAAQLSAAACLPHQLAQASLCLWRIDASIDVTDAVYSIHCAHPMVSDASLVVAIAKRLLVTGKLECARAFFVQLANNPGLQTPFGAVATACAIPSVDSWPIVWHDARRRCDAIAVTNTVEANAARAAIARHVAIWAINMGELGAVLESKLTSIEESAIHDMLLARWEMELVEVGNQHVFHDILLAWYLHRDMHEDARQLMRRFSDQHGMQGEEENPDGAGVFAPTLMRAFEDVFAT